MRIRRILHPTLNAGTTALVLLAVPFLPRQLIDRRDAAPGA